tara:strand:+ start:374 stop:661 length:288 start_codon:yes stop_codon:yes gene_type:complete
MHSLVKPKDQLPNNQNPLYRYIVQKELARPNQFDRICRAPKQKQSCGFASPEAAITQISKPPNPTNLSPCFADVIITNDQNTAYQLRACMSCTGT